MKLNFDLENIQSSQFGVGRDDNGKEAFHVVGVDRKVQDALAEMAVDTWKAMQKKAKSPAIYQASEKHESQEYLYLPLDNELAEWSRNIHEAKNLVPNASAFENPSGIVYYVARFKDSTKRRLTAVRRAVQFKGVLKNRLVHFVTDALKLVEDDVFRLDSDFDLLIDSKNVHILRPSAFEFLGKLQEAVMAAVPKNVKAIAADITFVDFQTVGEYACEHPRAARYLASIRGQKTEGISKNLLRSLCTENKAEIQTKNGMLFVSDSHVMGFLEALDRRLYGVTLIPNHKERFKASSRSKVGED